MSNNLMRVIVYSLCIIMLTCILLGGLRINLFRFLGEKQEENTGNGTVDPNQIQGIKIDWAYGSITIKPTPGVDQIRFSESAANSNIKPLVWSIEDNILSIMFCEESIQVGINHNYDKDLVIEVPENWLCRELTIDAASANVYILNMSIDEFDFNSASGACRMEHCTVNKLNMDAVSGDAYFSGSLNELHYDGVSAKCTLVVANIPRSIDFEGVSGDFDITLPTNCGFTVNVDGLNSNFHSEFETTVINGEYRYSDGSCSINCSSVSGAITIRKGNADAQ